MTVSSRRIRGGRVLADAVSQVAVLLGRDGCSCDNEQLHTPVRHWKMCTCTCGHGMQEFILLACVAGSACRSVSGHYNTVTCLDVMIHYPQDKADAMITHLASLAEKKLIISFAPYTPYYALLKRIGELFPGPSKVRAPQAAAHASECRHEKSCLAISQRPVGLCYRD